MLNYNFIWICLPILIFGIIDIIIKISQTRQEDSSILQFNNTIKQLYNNIRKNKNTDNEIQYIISKSKYINKLLTKGSECSYVIDFVYMIAQKKYNSQEMNLNFINIYTIQYLEENKQKRITLRKSLLNPIELFCRGVEVILRFCFAYFISLLKSDFDYNGRTWKLIVGIISFIGAVLTILGFFGITFNDLYS